MIDEVCLSSGLSYDSVTDQIVGFVAMVLIKVRILPTMHWFLWSEESKKKFKQPIAYSFCKGATTQHELIRQLKQVNIFISSLFK